MMLSASIPPYKRLNSDYSGPNLQNFFGDILLELFKIFFKQSGKFLLKADLRWIIYGFTTTALLSFSAPIMYRILALLSYSTDYRGPTPYQTAKRETATRDPESDATFTSRHFPVFSFLFEK